jgi:PAS domain S-box-containing protein
MKHLPNLLIVDDSEVNLYLLEKAISNIKVNLISAHSGEEALEKTHGIDLALAIIDVRMPVMDGFELAIRLNKERSEDKVPVIFVTANGFNNTEVFKGYKSGAVDYITKPIENTILVCKINVFLDLFNQKQIIIRDAELLAEAAADLGRVNTALKKSEGRLRDIMFSMADWVWEVDEKGVYTYSSNRGADLLGVSQEDIIGKTMFDFMPKDEVKRATDIFSEIMSNKAAIKDFESWNFGRNGERICLLTNGVPIIDENGNFKGYRGIDKDITERKCAEAALQESEEKFRSVTQSANDAIITSNSSGIITDWNDGAEKIFGYTEYEIVGKNLAEILPQQYREIYFENIERVVKGEGFTIIGKVFEFKGLRKDKSEFPLELSLAEWETDSGRFFTGIIRDITTRKQSEEALKQISARLELAVRAGGIGVWDLNLEDNSLLWDDRMFELYGVKKESSLLAFEAWLDGLHPDDLSQSFADIKLAIQGKKEFDTEFRVCWSDGTTHNIRANAVVIYNSSGTPVRMIGTNWDITGQKRLEEKLISSEANFRTFFETHSDLIMVGNKKGEIIYVNEAVSRKLGFTHAELLQMHLLDLNPQEMRPEAEEIFNDMFAGKRDICPLPLVKKDGAWIPVETRIWFGRWNGEDCIFGLSKDLSAEQEALQKFNKIFDNNPALMAITSIPEGIFTDVNNTFLLKTGFTKEEVIGKTVDELGLFLQPEKQKAANEELAKNGVLHNFELQINTSSGKIVDGLFSGEIIKSHDKKFFLTVMVDITERKLADNIIRESESNLAEAQRIAHIGSWEWDLVSNSVKWSKEMFNVFDIDPDTYDVKPESLIKMLHPNDIESFTQNMNQNLLGGDFPSLEYRVIHNDGSVHNILAEGRKILDENGKPLKSIGTVQDITERKRAEQTLKVSEEKYRTMLNASPDGIFLINFNGRITDVSEIGIELIGYENKEELIGKHFLSFVPKEGKKTILSIITKTLNEGISQNIEMKIKKKNQSMFLSEASSTLIQGADGKPFAFMIIIRDISFRKKMEAKQIHSDRMANLGEMASGIAHEINQPLNIISMVLDKILFETAKTDTIDVGFLKTKADKIFENIIRIRNIIDHVRAFSRSHDDYVLTAFDINGSIENAASMLAEQFRHLGINLTLNLDNNIPQLVGNTYKFEQVIVNLLTNAKDAVIEKKSKQEGYTDLFVGIHSYQENHFLIIEIIDNGIGIVNDDLHNIMLPFYTTKEEGKGTGLGLSISYQIIKEMGGTIDITSDNTNGTIIKLVLDTKKGK